MSELVLKPAFATAQELNLSAQTFLQSVFFETDNLGIHFPNHWDVDHICYRVPTMERYEYLKKDFAHFGSLLTESFVNGRQISTFRLREPIFFGDYQINIMELPAPRADRFFSEGFEHIESVFDLPFEMLANQFFPPTVSLNRSDEKKVFNKEVKLHLKSGTIKFHHLSLESIVRLEKHKAAAKALKTSRVLEKLCTYEPLAVGTFPLELNIESSDIDVVIGGAALPVLKEQLRGQFGHHDLFSLQETTENGVPTVVVAFLWDQFSFEIYGQEKPSVQQEAYLHFQVEERLLKLGTPAFFEAVKAHRRAGHKTEPAFAKALALPGDPFAALLSLHTAANSILREYLRAADPVFSL